MVTIYQVSQVDRHQDGNVYAYPTGYYAIKVEHQQTSASEVPGMWKQKRIGE